MALVDDHLDAALKNMSPPPMQISSKKKPLYAVADLLAIAILRKIARKNGKSGTKALDLTDGRSVCVDVKKTSEENA